MQATTLTLLRSLTCLLLSMHLHCHSQAGFLRTKPLTEGWESSGAADGSADLLCSSDRGDWSSYMHWLTLVIE